MSSASGNNQVPSLFIVPGFISPEQERRLIQLIDVDYATEWRSDLVRRVQHYGYRYDYKARRADPTMRLGPLPDFLSDLAGRLVQKDWFQQAPDQAIVNEYLPGQGISAHVDCVPCFGPVVASLSLGSDCVMDFRRKADDMRQSILAERRGLIVLTNDARYKWTHAIPARLKDALDGVVIERTRRISITFRTIVLRSKKHGTRSPSL